MNFKISSIFIDNLNLKIFTYIKFNLLTLEYDYDD